MSRRRPGFAGSGGPSSARFRKSCYQHTQRCPLEIDERGECSDGAIVAPCSGFAVLR